MNKMYRRCFIRKVFLTWFVAVLGVLHVSCQNVDNSEKSATASPTKANKLDIEQLLDEAQTGITDLENGATGATSNSSFSPPLNNQGNPSTFVQASLAASQNCAVQSGNLNGSQHDYYSFEGSSCPVEGHLRVTSTSSSRQDLDLDLKITSSDLQNNLHLKKAKVTGSIRLISVGKGASQKLETHRFFVGEITSPDGPTLHVRLRSQKAEDFLWQDVGYFAGQEAVHWAFKKNRSGTVCTRNQIARTPEQYAVEMAKWGALFTQLFREAE